MDDLFSGSKETPASLKNHGNILLNEGRVSEAEHLYRRAIELDPGFMPAHYNLGNTLRVQGRFEEALVAYETALGLAPGDYEIHMNIGATLLDLGRAADALQAFSYANELMPTAAEPLVNMGLACERLGQMEKSLASGNRSQEVDSDGPNNHGNLNPVPQAPNKFEMAVEYYNKALLINPNLAVAHNNLGFVLQFQGRLDEAVESLQYALSLNPDFSEAHNNLGNVLQAQGRLEEAIERFRHAFSLNPDFVDAHYNLGNAYKDLKRFEESEASYRKALAINPNYVSALNSLGGLLMECGRPNEAMDCFQQVIRLDPDNAAASHLIASMTGSDSERAPSQYVAELFDGFASNFEVSLLENLKYETPKKLVALITDFAKPAAEKWDILDLGCGTGLVGPAIAPYARQLVGVDLSAGMLAKAQEKKLYQRLERSELLDMMKGELASSYDVIIAADVFVYIGKLDAIMQEIKRLLRPGGMLAFSVEALDALSNEEGTEDSGRDYQLNHTGRYSHSSSYINKIANTIGLKRHSLTLSNIRLEKGEPVQGWLTLLENTGA